MLLTGKNIRETVLFPIVKPDQRGAEAKPAAGADADQTQE